MPEIASYPTYDLMLLLSTEVEDERREEIVSNAEAAIAQEGGEVVGSYDWGVRSLAYEIRHQPDAHYRLIQFSGPPSLLESLDHTLKITDGVTRFRIIKILPGTPPAPDRQEDEYPVEAEPEESYGEAAEAA
jgi:small subunit ribosomal protein S6